ncbi:hypothetical protein JVU11DRAFT_165 [Chiua virens]|nr:hypothetical protein JVU11DRAFT_165 [Chiua virens]
MGDTSVSKWAAGASYGPVLSQTDLYLLNTELQLHPILQGTDASFHLIFNLVTGAVDVFNGARLEDSTVKLEIVIFPYCKRRTRHIAACHGPYHYHRTQPMVHDRS